MPTRRPAPGTAHRLTAALASAGVPVADAAEQLGVHPHYLYRVAAGAFAPSPRLVEGVARLLGATEDDVLRLCPVPPGGLPFPPCSAAVEALAAAGVAQSDLAARAGIKPSNVSAYLRGARRPTPKLMAAVELATGQPRERLFPHLFSGGGADGE